MNDRPTCIKTGCALMLNEEMYWGDLYHYRNGTLTFNSASAAGHPNGREEDLAPGDCIVTLKPSGGFFVRRGVFVFERAECHFNDLLVAFVGPEQEARHGQHL